MDHQTFQMQTCGSCRGAGDRPARRRVLHRSRPRRRRPAWALRRLPGTRGLALVAMLLQVLLAADHLGATAGAGRAAPGARLGLLEICTGEGIVTLSPDGRPVDDPAGPPGHSPPPCPVCASASVGPVDAPYAAALPAPGTDVAATPEAPFAVRRALLRVWRSAAPIRAPPVA